MSFYKITFNKKFVGQYVSNDDETRYVKIPAEYTYDDSNYLDDKSIMKKLAFDICHAKGESDTVSVYDRISSSPFDDRCESVFLDELADSVEELNITPVAGGQQRTR